MQYKVRIRDVSQRSCKSIGRG